MANIFNAPGHKNEYLTRIALTVFSKVSTRKVFDEQDLKDYKILKTQAQYISAKDPITELVHALNEMYSLYA